MVFIDKIVATVDLLFKYKAFIMLAIVIFSFCFLLSLFNLVCELIAKKREKNFSRFLRDVGVGLFSGVKLGVGFAGILFVFGFFVENIGPAVKAIIATRGLDFPVLDIGWPPLAEITWASIIAPLTIPLFFLINIILVLLNLSRTINLDIWNYWHYAFLGALVHSVSQSFVLGMAATILVGVYTLKMSDWSVPYIKEECDLHGITISPLSAVGLLPLAVVINKLLDKIPLIKDLEYNANKGKSKFDFLNEPMVIGILVGILLGLLADYSTNKIMELAFHIAAVMYILPHFGELIGKSMEPIADILKKTITRFLPHRDDLVIAVDVPVILKNRSVIVTGLIMMPLSLGLAFFIPGNKTIPLGDLPNLITVTAIIVLAARSNVIRGIIIGVPVVISYLLVATYMAPLCTKLAQQVGANSIKNYDGLITAFTDGGNLIRFWFYAMFSGNILALGLLVLALPLLFVTWRIYKRSS